MITVDFKDFNEMMTFAKQLAGLEPAVQPATPEILKQEKKAESPAPAVPTVAAAQPQTAVPASPMPPQAPAHAPMPAPVASVPVSVPAPASAPVPAVPTSTVSYTQDDLARAAMALMDAGRQSDLIALLQQFGVSSLPSLPAEKFGAFATALRGMGAQI